MRSSDVRGFVAPDGRSTKGRLQTNNSPPRTSELCREGTRALLAPCLPCHTADQQDDRQSDQSVSHLQPDLRRRDRIELLRAQPMRINLPQKRRVHWRPGFSVREGKVRHGKSSMLMSHSGSKDQLDENQTGAADCQPIKASRNASRSK